MCVCVWVCVLAKGWLWQLAATSTSSDSCVIIPFVAAAFLVFSLFLFLFWLLKCAPLFIVECHYVSVCLCLCVWLPLHSAIGGHFVCCCPPKMRLNRKVATWDELSFPSSLLPLFLCRFLAVSLSSLCPFLGAVRLAFSSGGCHGNTHTHTHAYSRRHFVAKFGVCLCVCCLPLGALGSFWL